jgi:signal transduction histidine kinase
VEEVRAGAEKTRTLSHVLMPTSLREERLASALETLCHKYQEIGAPAPSFEGDRAEPLPAREETAVHLYRIAREALINAQRHADAEHIWVRLGREDGRLVLTVRDDGKGMAGSEDEQGGVGLRTMTHRADLIGATLSIDAAEEGGTTVRCALPLPEAQRE